MFILILLGSFLISFNAHSGEMLFSSGPDLMGDCRENLALVEVVTKGKIEAQYSCRALTTKRNSRVILDGDYRNPLTGNKNSVSLNQVQFERAHECETAGRYFKYIVSEKPGLKIQIHCDDDNILSVIMVRE